MALIKWEDYDVITKSYLSSSLLNKGALGGQAYLNLSYTVTWRVKRQLGYFCPKDEMENTIHQESVISHANTSIWRKVFLLFILTREQKLKWAFLLECFLTDSLRVTEGHASRKSNLTSSSAPLGNHQNIWNWRNIVFTTKSGNYFFLTCTKRGHPFSLWFSGDS